MIATIVGPSRRDFWKQGEPIRANGAPYRVNHLMSCNRFEDILYSLEFTDSNPPPYKDKFWMIRDLQKAWNDNMFENFDPGWAT